MSDFETIYHQYFRFVWSSVRRLGVGTEAIDDVVQEVFIVIHARLDTVRDPTALRSWIYGVVRRTVSGYRRANKLKSDSVSVFTPDELASSDELSPLARSEQKAELELLSTLLAGLSEAKREVLMLVELEEMSVPEVAEALEIPLNTAYSRLRHARKEFDAALSHARARNTRRGVA